MSYQWLSAREHALHRPDTYAGSVVPCDLTTHVLCTENGSVVRRDTTVSVAPALLKVSDEAIVNAVDNHIRDVTQKNIKVSFEPDGVFSVFNDGSSIPIELWNATTRYVPEILFGEMMSGENFNDSVDRVVGGRNGIGIKIAAVLSEWFEVTIVNLSDNTLVHTIANADLKLLSKKVADQEAARICFKEENVVKWGGAEFVGVGSDGVCDRDTLIMVKDMVYHNYGPLRYMQRFEQNLSTTHPPCISRATPKDRCSSTLVRWKVDLARLHMSAPLSDGVLSVLGTRAYDAAACTHARVSVWLNGVRVPCKTMKDYAIGMGGDWIGRDIVQEGPSSIDVCVTRATESAPGMCVGFVNGVRCSMGTHIDVVYRRMAEALSELVSKRSKRSVTIQPAQLHKHITVVVGATVINPAFSSQTKEKLTVRVDKLGVVYVCSPVLVRALERSGVVQSLWDAVVAQDEKSVSKSVKTDRARVSAIPKYERAIKLASKQPCSLYITEGDSAKALAVAGFSVIGRDYNGVFPLKGKLVNVNDMPITKAVLNKEILHLTQILGLDPNTSYTPEKALLLPYRRLIIFTDQDHDGSHITGLILNWLQTFFPTLLSALPDFVSRFATPIIRARVDGEVKSFFSQIEYSAWLAGRHPTMVKYYKGLGTSDTDDARRYFSNLDSHLIVVRHTGRPCADAVQVFFNARKTQERKNLLKNSDPSSFVDYMQAQTSWTDFLHKEMIHFGTADNRRSLASCIDGLKPSQRKVLYTALRRKKGETRVGQFASATAEATCYHHGEASLVQTIVNMAQPWMGANNVALLKPLGMFGARHMPRTEHSAERYIFTEQHEIARRFFPAADDHILTLLTDDGQAIEPSCLCPIVPFLLVNGADGIGTGWRCHCPAFDPIEIVRNTRLLVDNVHAALPHMTPSYFGFKGTVAHGSEGEYLFTGVWKVESATAVRITELPPKTWTTPYVEWIREHLVGDGSKRFVLDIIDSSTHDDVNLLVRTKADANLAERNLAKDLKLTVAIDTRQLNFFDVKGVLCHYERVHDVMREHAVHRRMMYEKRVASAIDGLSHDYKIATSKSRFVADVCEQKIVPSQHTTLELRDWLRQNNYYDTDDFKYLEGLGMFSMTRDASLRLCRHADALLEKLKALQSITIERIWHGELDDLEQALHQYMKEIEAKRMPPIDGKKRKPSSEKSNSKKKRGI